MSRLQVQRTELVDAKSDSIRRAFAVKTPDSAVSWPEFRIARLLPGLRVLPANLATTQQLPQSFQRNRSDDLLFDQVVPQRRQRPDAHAEQLSRRREGHFHNLFDNVRKELGWSLLVAVGRIPDDGLNPAAIEAVDDLPDPLGGTSGAKRNLPVAQTARESKIMLTWRLFTALDR